MKSTIMDPRVRVHTGQRPRHCIVFIDLARPRCLFSEGDEADVTVFRIRRVTFIQMLKEA